MNDRRTALYICLCKQKMNEQKQSREPFFVTLRGNCRSARVLILLLYKQERFSDREDRDSDLILAEVPSTCEVRLQYVR